MRMYNRKSITQYRKALSSRESRILSSLSYEGNNIFTTDDVKRFVKEPKNLLDNLVRKKWILKIRKGVYVIAPFEAGERGASSYTIHSFVIGSVLVRPYYVGYWSALNHHGLTDQTPPAVYVATTRPKNSRKILDIEFRFVTIRKRKMFGIMEIELEKRKVRISSPEKTIVDCLDHPEHSGGIEEVAKALYFARERIDFKKLVRFAKKIGNNAVIKRLGYLSETLKLERCLRLLSKARLKTGYSLLDPTLPRHGRIIERWKLVLNAKIEETRWTR